ncbi:uncharacterized protein LOC144459474 [Epinephelus lanceolatus]
MGRCVSGPDLQHPEQHLQLSRHRLQEEDNVTGRGMLVSIHRHHPLPSSTVIIHCQHPPPSSTAFIHRHHPLPSSTVIIHCHHPLSSSTAIIRRQHLPPSLAALAPEWASQQVGS